MTHAAVFWFTGLSGAGKSTLAAGVSRRLEAEGRRVLVLDGDAVRGELHRGLGFTPAEIRENNRRIAELCAANRADYDAILVPIISPYRSSRRAARARLAPGFYEIHVKASVETVAARDVKGLYAKARRGEIANLIGYSEGAPYEAPSAPDLVIDTERETADGAIEALYGFVRGRIGEAGGG